VAPPLYAYGALIQAWQGIITTPTSTAVLPLRAARDFNIVNQVRTMELYHKYLTPNNFFVLSSPKGDHSIKNIKLLYFFCEILK
jgi:hypothetical protein